MSDPEAGPTPDLEQLQQDYGGPSPWPFGSIPILTTEPVNGHDLPAIDADSRFLNIDANNTVEVAAFDPGRKYLTVISTVNVYIGHDKQLVAQGEVGQLPAGVPLPLPTRAHVYARSAAGPGVLSYWQGRWAA